MEQTYLKTGTHFGTTCQKWCDASSDWSTLPYKSFQNLSKGAISATMLPFLPRSKGFQLVSFENIVHLSCLFAVHCCRKAPANQARVRCGDAGFQWNTWNTWIIGVSLSRSLVHKSLWGRQICRGIIQWLITYKNLVVDDLQVSEIALGCNQALYLRVCIYVYLQKNIL